MSEEYLPIRLDQQGAIVLDKHGPPTALVLERAETLLLLSVDCDSKYGELFMAGGGDNDAPGVWLDAKANTLYLHPDYPRDAPTRISFPGLVGWEVVLAAWSGRYSSLLCLRRVPKP